MRFVCLLIVGLGRMLLCEGALPLPTRIVVARNATETELWAAGKLADLLMLPIMDSDGMAAGTGHHQIAVGHGAATALGVPLGALANLDDDSYLISTARGVPVGSVAIASSVGSTRGSIHGVFAFLRVLGFEFFAENVTRVPSLLPTLPTIDTTYSPSFDSRDLTMASRGIGSNFDRALFPNGNCAAVAKAKHWSGGQCQRHGLWWRPGRNLSAALGLNGQFSFGPVGGFLAPSDPPGFVATANSLLTPSLNADVPDCAGPGTYEPHEKNTPCPAVFRQHPDWFTCGQPAAPCTSVSINKTFYSQPCWSAPGVVETMTKNILRILHANPTTKIVSVSNMDGGVSYSPCPMDMVAAKAENATGGANFYAVRDIAAAVVHEFPDVKIQALAVSTHASNPHRNLICIDISDRLLAITVQRCKSATEAPRLCRQCHRPDCWHQTCPFLDTPPRECCQLGNHPRVAEPFEISQHLERCQRRTDHPARRLHSASVAHQGAS